MITHNPPAIFVHIVRTAGTSLEHAIYGNNFWRAPHGGNLRKHLTAGLAAACYADFWSRYFTFAIVRHPATWLLSQFLREFEHQDPTPAKWFRHLERPGPLAVSARLMTIGAAIENTQTEILNAPVDYIGHFERLPTAYRTIAAALDFDAPPLEHHERPGAPIDKARYLTPAALDTIAERCAADFDAFGYERRPGPPVGPIDARFLRRRSPTPCPTCRPSWPRCAASTRHPSATRPAITP